MKKGAIHCLNSWPQISTPNLSSLAVAPFLKLLSQNRLGGSEHHTLQPCQTGAPHKISCHALSVLAVYIGNSPKMAKRKRALPFSRVLSHLWIFRSCQYFRFYWNFSISSKLSLAGYPNMRKNLFKGNDLQMCHTNHQ